MSTLLSCCNISVHFSVVMFFRMPFILFVRNFSRIMAGECTEGIFLFFDCLGGVEAYVHHITPTVSENSD